MNIADFIPKGKENAIHLEQLAHALNMSDTCIKKHIKEARRNGAPIMSAKCGYWLTENEAERRAFIDNMNAQGYARLKTARDFANNGEIIGQQHITDNKA